MHKEQREVVVRFSSGLGNQLFQLACGIAATKAAGGLLRSDTTWYRFVAPMHHPLRKFRLPKLQVPLHEAFRGPRRWAIGITAAVFDRWGRGRRLCQSLGMMKIEQEKKPMTTQEIVCSSGRTYLNGYWQTAQHYLAARCELLAMLQPKAALSPGAKPWFEKIKSRKTAFLHVRRGDYEIHAGDEGLLPPSYYRRAADELRSRGVSDLHWAVFAEDEAWAERHLQFLGSFEIVRYESPDRDIEDMRLMASCDAGVVANSSYSWWGAATGEKDGRPIVAPDKYWRSAADSTHAWRLPSWIAVEAWE